MARAANLTRRSWDLCERCLDARRPQVLHRNCYKHNDPKGDAFFTFFEKHPWRWHAGPHRPTVHFGATSTGALPAKLSVSATSSTTAETKPSA